jgi:hypothetical protein
MMELVDMVFKSEEPYKLLDQCIPLMTEFSGRKTRKTGADSVNDLFDTDDGETTEVIAEAGAFDDPNDAELEKLVIGVE